MENLKLSQKFSIIALNAQDSIHMTTVKKISLRCIAAAVVLESYLDGDFREENGGLKFTTSILDEASCPLYKDELFRLLLKKNKGLTGDLNLWLSKASNLPNKDLKALESRMGDFLKGNDLIQEIPNLLGCDLYFKSAGVSIKEYRSDAEAHSYIIENIRAEVLEDGAVSEESIMMLWLLRESACFDFVFSKNELERVAFRKNELNKTQATNLKLFEINIYHGLELGIKGFLNMKKNAVKTPTGTGINFIFPNLERSQSIFIDTEEWFPSAEERLKQVKERLESHGHTYTVIRGGSVPLIKIDNIIYEAMPQALTETITIHGVRLRRYCI